MSVMRRCDGVTRRNAVQVGLGGMLGTGLAGGLRAMAESRKSGGPVSKATSCILIWMDGGPTHFETFDPKPDAPAEYRGDFADIATAVSGVGYSEHMVKLAASLNDYAMIRSIRHDQGNHGAGNHYMMTGAPPRIPVGCGAFVSFHPSMGSVAARELGRDNGLPAYFSMPQMSRSGGPNFLGARYAPFVVGDDPNSKRFKVRDVALPRDLSELRFTSRTELRAKVDRMVRLQDEAAGDPAAAYDEYYRQGFSLVTSVQAQQAFDIHQEPEAVRDRYGRNSFGQRCLLSRRLVEAGVRVVTVAYGFWDTSGNNVGHCRAHLPTFDTGIAALIQDLHARGLDQDVTLVVWGEFGRTPKINDKAGRDHWAPVQSALFSGGGMPMGQVIGSTDKIAAYAADRPIHYRDVLSTIYHNVGIDSSNYIRDAAERPVRILPEEARPIRELATTT